MWMDRKYRITQELLKILKHYRYPYIIATRSDLIAEDDYISLMDPSLAAIQVSIISGNEKMNRLLEPGAPSARRRLRALEKLRSVGFWTTVRINPLFPIFPDGHFSKPGASVKNISLDVFSWDLIEEIADAQVPAIIAGFGRFSSYAMNQMSAALETDLRLFFNGKKFANTRDFHFSDEEIRYYYERIRAICLRRNVEFTTCYIGNGEPFFWKDQDLWANKEDCCNAKGRVEAFSRSAQEIPFGERLRFSTSSCARPSRSERAKIDCFSKIPEFARSNNPFLHSQG
jgi:DNA repair photolyase